MQGLSQEWNSKDLINNKSGKKENGNLPRAKYEGKINTPIFLIIF